MTRLADGMLGGPDTGFVLVEWTADADTNQERPIAPLHRHHDEDEAWYVLEGKLGFRIGDDIVVAVAGEAVFAPRGAPHTYWHEGEADARYILVMGPKTYALIDAIHAAPSRDPDAMRALFDAYDSELA